MEFENVYRVESFLINNEEERYVNDLLASGWELLTVSQYKDDYHSYSKYVIGADKKTFEKINVQHIKEKIEQEKADGWADWERN